MLLGAIAAFLSSLTWALGSSAYGKLSREHSPFSVNFSRALVALPLFGIAALIAFGGPKELASAVGMLSGRTLSWLALSMFASYGLGDVLFLWSARSLGVPSALAICSCYPIWTAITGVVFLEQPLDVARVVGMGVTLGGVVVVILSGAPAGPRPGRGTHSARRGVGLALLASLCWALNSVSVSVGAIGLSPLLANLIRMAFALGISSALGRVMAPGARAVLHWRDLRPVLWIFAAESFGGSLFYIYGLTHAPLAVAAVLCSVAPVIAVPIAWMLTGERPTALKTLGICLTVTGIGLLAF